MGIHLINQKGKSPTGTLESAGNLSLDVHVTNDAGSAIPITGSISFAEEAVAADGAALPALTKVISGYDGSAVQVIKTDASGNLNANVLSSALPTGAATETTLASVDSNVAAQSGNIANIDTSTASLDGKIPAQGQAAMAASIPVAIASDQSSIPVGDGGGSLTVDGTVAATQSGTWNITNVSGTVSLPTGAATEATLSAVDGKFGSLGQKAMAGSAPVVLASDQSAIPATQSGTWNITNVSGTVSLPTGAATEVTVAGIETAASSIDGKLGTLGQKAMAGSAPVVLASDQSAIPATQSGTWNINNVSGTVSLPTGAATEATLASVDGKFGSLGQKAMTGSAPVVLASDQSAIPASQSGTWNITNVSGTVSLPTGAATETTLASVDGKLGTLGQKTMAGSAPVVIASNQTSIPVSQGGRSVVDTVRNDYSSVNVTTGAWVQLIASTASAANELEIFDSSGQTLEIGTGAAASETRLLIVFPGGNGRVPVSVAASTRISIRAISATASAGEIDINLYS